MTPAVFDLDHQPQGSQPEIETCECVHCPICNAGVCVAEVVGGRVRCPACGCLIKLEEKNE